MHAKDDQFRLNSFRHLKNIRICSPNNNLYRCVWWARAFKSTEMIADCLLSYLSLRIRKRIGQVLINDMDNGQIGTQVSCKADRTL